MYKYETVYEELLTLARAGKPNDGFPTEMEIARRFRVSRFTARKALNMLYKDGAVYRKTKTGTFVAPPRNGKRIAVALPFENINDSKIMDAILDNNARFGYEIDVFFSHLNMRKERGILETVLAKKYDGLLFSPSNDSGHADLISRFILSRVPLVLMDIEILGFDLPLVCSDNEGGYYEIVTHFIRKGLTKFLFIMPESAESMSSVRDRYRGYCRALLENGIPVRLEYIFQPNCFGNNFLTLSVKEQNAVQIKNAHMLHEYCLSLPDPPEAVCFINDASAVWFINYLQRYDAGLLDKVTMIGFDGLTVGRKLNLSTVRQNFYAIGKNALLTLDKIFAGETPKSRTEIKTRMILV